MKEKFEAKVAETEKHETEDRYEYAMLKQDLDNQLATASNSRNTKAEMKAKAMQDAADAQGSLTDLIRCPTCATREPGLRRKASKSVKYALLRCGALDGARPIFGAILPRSAMIWGRFAAFRNDLVSICGDLQ